MTKKEAILKEVEQLPDALLGELASFVRLLKTRAAKQGPQGSETAFLSEPSLAKDWNRPEEDEAWRDL